MAQQLRVHLDEDPCAHPLHHSQMARRARPELGRESLPLTPRAHSVEDARHGHAVRYPGPPATRLRALLRHQRLDPLPQTLRHVEEVLIHGLSKSIFSAGLKGFRTCSKPSNLDEKTAPVAAPLH